MEEYGWFVFRMFGNDYVWGLVFFGLEKWFYYMLFVVFDQDLLGIVVNLERLGIVVLMVLLDFFINGLWICDFDGVVIEIKVVVKLLLDGKLIVGVVFGVEGICGCMFCYEVFVVCFL